MPFVVWPLPSWVTPLLPPLRAWYMLLPSPRWPRPRLPHLVQVSAPLPPPPGGLPWPPSERAPLSHPSPFFLCLIFLHIGNCCLSFIFAYCLSDPWGRTWVCLLADALAHRKYSIQDSIFQQGKGKMTGWSLRRVETSDPGWAAIFTDHD